jgi:hypothetical protein
MDYKNLKLNDNIYLDVDGTVTAEFSTQISYEWIIDAICDSQPSHVGQHLLASIEHDTNADAEGKFNSNQVSKAIEGTMLMHGIQMTDLVKNHPIDVQESYERMTVENIQDLGEIIITSRARK